MLPAVPLPTMFAPSQSRTSKTIAEQWNGSRKQSKTHFAPRFREVSAAFDWQSRLEWNEVGYGCRNDQRNTATKAQHGRNIGLSPDLKTKRNMRNTVAKESVAMLRSRARGNRRSTRGPRLGCAPL